MTIALKKRKKNTAKKGQKSRLERGCYLCSGAGKLHSLGSDGSYSPCVSNVTLSWIAKAAMGNSRHVGSLCCNKTLLQKQAMGQISLLRLSLPTPVH